MASAVFYLTNKPAYPQQFLQDLFDADGASTAYYGKDVGSNWSEGSLLWAAGDNVVVVVETIRGQNGWTGSNWTTSGDGVLTTANIDTLPLATNEAMPTLALVKSPGAVDVRWTGLLDANGNVLSYEVYRAPSLAGPWTLRGRSGLQNPGGAMNFNDGGLSPATYCYKIAANYRRDGSGGVYTTTGTSEPQCATLGVAPMITSTSPIDGDTGVGLNAVVTVVFSEAMDQPSVTYPLSPPDVTFTPSWNIGSTILTLTHTAPFVQCRTYTMTIGGRDLDDNFALVAGTVPNPFSFTTICPNPQITVTSPANGVTGVSRTANVVITFSKAMDTITVTATPSPATITFTYGWDSPANMVLTLTHTTPFDACTPYTITVVGMDTTGNPLTAGPVPNPFTFTTNCLPNVSVSAPAASVCWSGGSPHDIAWTVTDETPPGSLLIGLYYTVAGGPSVTISGPLAGRASPYLWGVPSTINSASVVVRVEATDGAGEIGSGTSGTFEIDSTSPAVASTSPTNGLTDVPTNADIVITFSEAMSRAATEGAITITPTPPTTTPGWTVGDTVLTLSHSSALTANTQYTVTIGTGALDACSPGRGLASNYVFSFRTSPIRPNPPSAVAATAASATSVTLTWTAPTQNADGSSLPASSIQGYYIQRSTSLTGQRVNVTGSTPHAGTSYTDSGLSPSTTYYYWVRTVTTDIPARVSLDSTPPATVTTQASAPDLTWLWILLIIIIVVILVIALLAMRRRKKPEAMAGGYRPGEEPLSPGENSPGSGTDDSLENL